MESEEEDKFLTELQVLNKETTLHVSIVLKYACLEIMDWCSINDFKDGHSLI